MDLVILMVKIILNQEEKDCIDNVGSLALSLLIEEDFKITKPYCVVIDDKKMIIIKKAPKK